MKVTVLKYGVGYDLVVHTATGRMVVGIRCHTCGRVSFNVSDIEHRYCGACHVFHEDWLLSQQA